MRCVSRNAYRSGSFDCVRRPEAARGSYLAHDCHEFSCRRVVLAALFLSGGGIELPLRGVRCAGIVFLIVSLRAVRRRWWFSSLYSNSFAAYKGGMVCNCGLCESGVSVEIRVASSLGPMERPRLDTG